jgi:hypothetical protein
MRVGVGRRAAIWAAASWFLAAWGGSRGERRLVVYPVDGDVLYGQSSHDAEVAPSNGATQRIRALPDALSAAYSFKSFNNDRISLEYQLPKAALARYESSFGYYKMDITVIDTWLNDARQGAYKYALKTGKSQAQLNAALSALEKEHVKRTRDYMASKGFKILNGKTVSVDMPAVVRRGAPVVNPAAQALARIARQQGYDAEEVVGVAASLVQTALVYRIPEHIDRDGRHTGGIFQPATALLKGWGDCDTKTGLLAALLSNWPNYRMVGVGVPDHYLMAVLRTPDSGDVFVEHEGLQYVLIEPAGPAWLPPGHVAETTMALLDSQDGYRIEPFF